MSAASPHSAADNVIDVEALRRLLGTHPALGQREDRALRDHEERPQLCQPGDDVAGQSTAEPRMTGGDVRFSERRHGQRRADRTLFGQGRKTRCRGEFRRA